MVTLKLCKYLISENRHLIEKTAIRNCHCIGLNSFIINEKPKIRLFIAENNCELFDFFDFQNPIIPIHPHKYDDIFSQLEGELIHHLYEVGGGFEIGKYTYQRLSDQKNEIKLIGKENLKYLGSRNDITELKSSELHTASISGDRCSWLITETFKDDNFKQISYHQNLIEREGLYTEFDNSVEYLKSYFNF